MGGYLQVVTFWLSKSPRINTNRQTIKNEKTSNNSITKPITILLMGVDSELESIANASFNGD